MDNSQGRSKELEERTIKFSLQIIRLVKPLPETSENRIIKTQLIRSATGIGANYTEANNAASRLDFRNKIFIAKKEAAETRYWLRLLQEANENFSCHNEIFR